MGPDVAGEARLTVRLTPRGGRDEITGLDDEGVLRARVAAAPVDGAANTALVRLIARAAGMPRSAVRIDGGERSRTKRVIIDGISDAALRERLVDQG